MRLVSFLGTGGRISIGVVVEDGIVDVTDDVGSLPPGTEAAAWSLRSGQPLAAEGMLRLLQGGPSALAAIATHAAASHRAAIPLASAQLFAPVPRPGKIVAIGRNYADHLSELGGAASEQPRVISKFPSSVASPNAVLTISPAVRKLDYEAELAVVMGGFASDVAETEVDAVIAGYTILNDLSAREFQFDIQPAQTTFAKSGDGFAPMGPWLVTADEIADPQNLEIQCWLNGARVQHASTAQMIFPIRRLVSYISRYTTLEPGDIIATGTPAGSGAFREPPVYLAPGDRLRLEIASIGVLEHSFQ